MLPNYSQAKLHDNYAAPSDPDENSGTKTYKALVLGTKCMTGELRQTPKVKLLIRKSFGHRIHNSEYEKRE